MVLTRAGPSGDYFFYCFHQSRHLLGTVPAPRNLLENKGCLDLLSVRLACRAGNVAEHTAAPEGKP